MPITVGSMPSDGRTFVTPSLGVAILIHNWRLLVPGRSFPLLSGRVCCRAASDTLDASAGPFESQPMHRRKQYGHGFGEACYDHRRSDGKSRDSPRSEEHTSELQSLRHLVCRLLLEKKKTQKR